MTFFYRIYGFAHQLAKFVLENSVAPRIRFKHSRFVKGCTHDQCVSMWLNFVESSRIKKDTIDAVVHYAGYIEEKGEWCLPSWIWTNSAIVRMYCSTGNIEKATNLGEIIAKYQKECGGWIVRNDYDANGAIPILAPNDSAYIANNAFLSLYEVTKNERYLDIAKRCGDWIISTARPDGVVYTGYNMRDNVWNKDVIIVDTGFTGGLFSRLYAFTGDSRYKTFLEKFSIRYVELFYNLPQKGFCTSIGRGDRQQGGMFARGQAWALEGLIPAYNVLNKKSIKEIVDSTVETLLRQQCRNGGWPYNLTKKMMGEDCKAVSVIAKDMMDWYAITKDSRILESAKRALCWCREHTAIEGEAKGGIFSYCVEGAIVKDLYTSCAFVYASAYAIELQKQIENAKDYSNKMSR